MLELPDCPQQAHACGAQKQPNNQSGHAAGQARHIVPEDPPPAMSNCDDGDVRDQGRDREYDGVGTGSGICRLVKQQCGDSDPR